MKKKFLLLFSTIPLIATCQVGIGTTTPRGALDINKTTSYNLGLVLPANTSPTNMINPQGGNVVPGTIMYDSTADCVKVYSQHATGGTSPEGWGPCLNAPATPSVEANCAQNGFEGTYLNGAALSGAKFTVTLTNNSFSNVTIASQASDLTLSGVSGVSVSTVTPASSTLIPGQSVLITYNLTGTPTSTGTLTGTWKKLSLTCTNSVTVQSGTINSLNCTTGALTGTVEDKVAASGVTKVINYTATGTFQYPALSIPSTGATGLTMNIPAGTITNGSGGLTFTITGQTDVITNNETANATFTVNLGGQSCNFTIPITILAKCGPSDVTQVVEITSPATTRVWMDRNLGASRPALSSTDHAAYGCLIQWGRLSDGHGNVTWRSSTSADNKPSTTTLSSTDVPGNNLFITNPGGNGDWRSPQNDNLWQGVAGTNNPCPSGFRVPTQAEINAEIGSMNNTNDAFTSVFKLPAAGFVPYTGANIVSAGQVFNFTSSTVTGTTRSLTNFTATAKAINNVGRGSGNIVRCIKN
ncbi:hypothetical protein [Chryseobacterium sp. IT-36CA2]|uniref:hypothetical protein n=1 Tax=Chryseobacterium sp. IT-36CA2 TaxID=3026460 RepID=UPI0039E1A9CF